MTKENDEAYAEAQRRIAAAKASVATTLDLAIKDLLAIPPEIAGLAALTSLYLADAQVSDLAPIAGLTALTSLDLADAQVSDLAPIAGLTALTSLGLSGTQVGDLAPLAALTALTSLDLMGTRVSDLAPLAALTALTSLDLTGTQVSDLAPIARLTALTSLDLRHAQVSDLRPIRRMAVPDADDPFVSGLRFAESAATAFDPELARLSEVDDYLDRTRQSLAYLNALDDADYDRRLTDWRARQAGRRGDPCRQSDCPVLRHPG